jgi:hypothetical protein
MYELGSVAESRIVQMNRQDFCGWSSEGTPSNYAVTGPPGWINGTYSGVLTPHPDYFLAVLWKLLVGNKVLASSYTTDDSSTFDAHIWCSSGRSGNLHKSSSPVLTYVNSGNTPLKVSTSFVTTPRTEYFVTSSEGNFVLLTLYRF